jgi:hypothetical protein
MTEQTMIERIARTLWETNLLRQALAPDGIQNVGWNDLVLLARSDVTAKAYFDRIRLQAREVISAMREPTEAMWQAGMSACGGDGSFLDGYDAMIDAVLAE